MKAYGKAILRAVSRSKPRFIAIFAIMALGSGFYAGISAAAPNMRQTVDSYMDRQNFMDIGLISTLGFTKQDVQAVQQTAGVEAVMPTWQEDVMSHIDGMDTAIRVHALPQNGAEDAGSDSMNRPVLVSGNWPQTAQECVVDQKKTLGKQTLHIGDKVTVQEQNGLKLLKSTKFRITGFVQSPMYLSFTLGNTNIGNGQLSRYLYVLPQTFSAAAYTLLAVKVNNAASCNSFTAAYHNTVNPVCDSLSSLGKQRAPLREKEVTASARQQLVNGRKSYEAQKADAQKKLAAAKQQLDIASMQIRQSTTRLADAQNRITTGNDKLKEARASYAPGSAQYTQQKQQAEKQLSDASRKLQAGKDSIAQAQQKYDAGKAQLAAQEKKLSDAKATLDGQGQKLSDAKTQIDDSRQKLENSAGEVEQARQALALLDNSGQGASQEASTLRQTITDYEQKSAQLKDAQTQYATGQQAFAQAQQEYDRQSAAVQPKLEQAQQQLDDAANHLEKAQRQLDDGEAQYRTQRNAAREQLTDAETRLQQAKTQIDQKTQELVRAQKQLEQGQTQLAAAQNLLSENRLKYAQSEKDTQGKLAAAQKKLSAGEKQLNVLSKPAWYVLNRDQNVGYSSFTSDADRMQSIARLFPVFFFLVAALVVLTTMTRMVDEERTEIGSYKAMGFSRRAIANRYLLYALLVSVSGSIAGVIIGCLTLPTVCWNAYRLMYNAPPLTPRINLFYSVISCCASVLVTVLATFASCWAVLREKPASLLQPKAPKPGKRILLEHITPLWQHMNFSAKVTARNLFRYKKRFVMTVVGIAGCTALVLTGFGLKDSISHVVSNQYDDICQYNMVTNLQKALSDSTRTILNDRSVISQWMQYSCRSVDVENAKGSSMSVNLLVPKDAGALPQFIRLRDRRTKKPVYFGRDSVVVTEKLANRLRLKSGSKLILPDNSGKKHTFTVTGITENYIYHYVYVDPVLYQQITKETPNYSGIWGNYTGSEAGQASLNHRLMQQGDVMTMVFVHDYTKNFDNMIQALNAVVAVLIFCAGMLSFVVLYNLTNINITERSREMATLRVLGFYQRETAEYIYRETSILTFIGCALGLLLGVFMHRAVITTIEVDVCMFGREINSLSYLWSILLTLGFTAVVDLIMFPKFRKINMVESLKSVD